MLNHLADAEVVPLVRGFMVQIANELQRFAVILSILLVVGLRIDPAPIFRAFKPYVDLLDDRDLAGQKIREGGIAADLGKTEISILVRAGSDRFDFAFRGPEGDLRHFGTLDRLAVPDHLPLDLRKKYICTEQRHCFRSRQTY